MHEKGWLLGGVGSPPAPPPPRSPGSLIHLLGCPPGREAAPVETAVRGSVLLFNTLEMELTSFISFVSFWMFSIQASDQEYIREQLLRTE